MKITGICILVGSTVLTLLFPRWGLALPEGEFELGDAVYNGFYLFGIDAFYDHAGLFIGVLPGDDGLPEGYVVEALKNDGVTINALADFEMESGPYSPPGLGLDERSSAVLLALQCNHKPYPTGLDNSLDALVPAQPDWTGDVDDILAIRCDGLVEFAYEANGVLVWQKEGFWNISTAPGLPVHNDLPPLGNPHSPCYFYPKTQRGMGTCPEEGAVTSMIPRYAADLPLIESVEQTFDGLFDVFKVKASDPSSGIAYLRYARVNAGQEPQSSDWDVAEPDELGCYQEDREFTILAYRTGDYHFMAVDGGGNLSETWVESDFQPSQDNPAAAVHGFSVIGSSARWKVDSEFETGHYLVESAENPEGPWTSAGPAFPAGPGPREESIEDSGDWYRLTEVEESGRRKTQGLVRPGEPLAAAQYEAPPLDQLRERVFEFEQNRAEGLAGEPPRWGEGELATIYCPAALAYAAEHALADYWVWCGYQVEIVEIETFPADPDLLRSAIREDIATRAAAGGRYVQLIGDANDWQWFDLSEQGDELWTGSWASVHDGYLGSGYPPQGQADRDIIPAFMEPDTDPRDLNLAWFTPYALSDQPYSDVDDDGLPDLVLARLPFTHEIDLWAYGAKMQMNQSQGVFGADDVAFLVGDVETSAGHNTGQMARSAADSVAARLSPDTARTFLYQSDTPDAGERNLAAAALWNETHPEILVMFASLSNRSWPANFFDQTNWIRPWSMDMIPPFGTHAPLVFAGSCGGADFARTEDPDYGFPICHRFLAAWDRGALAWVGPTLGSWQAGNMELGLAFIENLVAEPSRSAAESFSLGLRRVLETYPERRDIVETVRSYVYLGDAVSRVAQTQIAVGVPDEDADLPRIRLERNFPNPFNPRTTIAFELDRKTRVELVLFDIRGRRVRSLHSGVTEAGRHRIEWDGRDEKGLSASTGVYILRLEAGDRALSRKILLIK